MDGDAGVQVVAPPIFLHPGRFHEQPPPPPLPKKRGSPWQSPGLRRGGNNLSQLDPNQNPPQPPDGNWNPKMWDWDSAGFVAKRVQQVRADESSKGSAEDGGGESLTLKLGHGAYSTAEQQQPAVRPNKRVCSGMPGAGGGFPMCQVDDCRADLSGAKDYHRRHKVCEIHSKTTRALVGKQMQRFCQQCSRFHPLSEFDEGKRSCRRRLAGHNRRRRKTQPEDAPSWLVPLDSQGNKGNGNVDVANLLAMLARLQGKPANGAVLPDRESVLQILSKLNSLPTGNTTSKLAAPAFLLDLNVSQVSESSPSEQSTEVNKGSPSAASTMDLLAALSAAVAASAPDALGALSQWSSDFSGEVKSKKTSGVAADVSSHNRLGQTIPFGEAAGNICHSLSQVEISKHPVHEAQGSLPLQLFTSTEHDNPPKMASSRKYLSSESRNPMDYRSPSSSPPVTQKLFPLHSAGESITLGRPAFDFFKESEKRAENGAVQSFSYQAGYASSSGSDPSPSSSRSDSQERTERILFKLFDKDPSSLPGSLRNQILSWLSNSPLEMESYIRPGCLVLSVYVLMPSVAWDELEKDFLRRISSLVHCSESEFLRNGRFFVQTNRQLALHKDGKIRLCKSWRTWSAPELTSVSPIAVVSGQETSLHLRGRNLTVPGTKIHCTYMGGYASKEVLGSAYPSTIYDDSSSESFSFPGGFPKVFGRCFIEVENGFKGNSFPVIIADEGICKELRALESEIEEESEITDVLSEGLVRPRSRDDALHFLHELGWLFQRKSASFDPFLTDFSCTRFKFLIMFSVERDWPAIVRTLLDMFVERSSKGDLLQESLEMLLETQLLSRAVKRKCRKMVNLLLNYSVEGGIDDFKIYVFQPNSVGPGGLTPLHLAASMLESEDIVDVLTDDPQQIGLRCWSLLKDDNGQSPYMYASMRNNHAYNTLVARKLVDRQNSQVTIIVGHGGTSLEKSGIARELEVPVRQPLQVRTCAQCAILEGPRFRPNVRSRGFLQQPYVVSMLAIAAVCVCVCLFCRGLPKIGNVAPFAWENLDYGPR